jgi:hypothetical protein
VENDDSFQEDNTVREWIRPMKTEYNILIRKPEETPGKKQTQMEE